MASFQKVNPAVDGNAGAFFGKSVDTLEIIFAPGNVATSVGPLGAWPIVIQTIEMTGTIEVLGQIGPIVSVAGAGNVACGVRLMTSGVNADNAANLQASIQALGTIVVGNAVIGFSNVNVAATQVNQITF
jgi:hypothetical protein